MYSYTQIIGLQSTTPIAADVHFMPMIWAWCDDRSKGLTAKCHLI